MLQRKRCAKGRRTRNRSISVSGLSQQKQGVRQELNPSVVIRATRLEEKKQTIKQGRWLVTSGTVPKTTIRTIRGRDNGVR